MLVDHSPSEIVTQLLGVLFSVLRLEFAYVRFEDPSGGAALERWRPESPAVAAELRKVLTAAPSRDLGAAIVPVASSTGDGVLRVASMSPALPGEQGLVLVGSKRTDFPTALELYLFRVAVGQATISIHTARRLNAERGARIAAETALADRNAFLASIAGEIEASVSPLAERAAQARAFANEMDSRQSSDDASARGSGKLDSESKTETSRSSVSSVVRLTRREAEVLGLLAQGLSNKEIGGIMWLSERTVERHITSLYRKIGVERRSEATAYALRHGPPDGMEHET